MTKGFIRFKRKKKYQSFLKRRSFWYILGVVSLFTFLFWVVVFSPFFEIQKIQVEGAHEISKENILSLVKDSFWQNFLGIPQNSIFLINTKELKENLQNTFPLISSILLQRSFPQSIIVEIKERKQVASWCLPLPTLLVDGQENVDVLCFAVDKEGIPFKEVKDTSSYVIFYSKDNAVLGKELLSPSSLFTLLDFKEIFEVVRDPLSIVVFKIEDNGEIEGVAKEGFKILLDLKEDIEWQKTKLRLVLEQKIPLEKREKLEYIDLRFGDQAYLKYQN